MIYLDTNLIARSLQVGHVHNAPATGAMHLLATRDRERFCISPQLLLEFYAIATRKVNGLSLAPNDTLAEINKLKQRFTLLPESPAIFPLLESLLAKYHPTNRRVFDARHVAVMLTHGLSKILTFNDADFAPSPKSSPSTPSTSSASRAPETTNE